MNKDIINIWKILIERQNNGYYISPFESYNACSADETFFTQYKNRLFLFLLGKSLLYRPFSEYICIIRVPLERKRDYHFHVVTAISPFFFGALRFK